MNEPVIVQGYAVPFNPQGEVKANTVGTTGGEFNGIKGEPQGSSFKDVGWAVFFIAHLLVVLVFLGMYGSAEAFSGVSGAVVSIAGASGVFAAILTSLALGFMMKFAKELVKMALVFSICMSGVIGVLGLLLGQVFMGVMGLISFAVGICYAYFVWPRIPFAAANLNTAITSIRSNLGIAAVAYVFLGIAFCWTLFWSASAASALASLGQGTLFLFFLSYYWTHQVLQNTVHVSTAGVVGTWWFTPQDASSCCSPAVKDSFLRATTLSFGSICFGSFLVALVQALRQLLYYAQDQEDCNILVCIIDCILSCIQGIIEYLNKWAYVYVGLYGYSYLEAGKNVMTLFQNKGWTAIITDDLVDNVLIMMSFCIGLASGLVGLLMSVVYKASLYNLGFDSPELIGFIIGFLVGFVIATVLFSVIGSATDTVIVCYAESPNEFQTNHPELSNEMRAAWRQAWPNEFSY